MANFTLLIDMDSVTVDMLSTWLEKYNARTGEQITQEKITDWLVDKFVDRPEVLDQILSEEGFFFDLKPMPGAVEGITQLHEEGFDVVFLTQPPRKSKTAIDDKRNWIKHYFPFYDLSNMIFAHRKFMIRGDVLFDDSPTHLETWKVHNPLGRTVAMDYAYNKDVLMLDFRASNWQQFVEYVLSARKGIDAYYAAYKDLSKSAIK